MENKHILTSDGELYHWGIKGMKWGVRRFQKKDGSLTPAGKKRRKDTSNWSEDAKEAARIKKKSVNEMSNAELQKLNNRQNLERQYSQLNPSAVKRGIAAIAATAAFMGTILKVVNNSDKIVGVGKNAGKKIVDRVGDHVLKDLGKGLSKGLLDG